MAATTKTPKTTTDATATATDAIEALDRAYQLQMEQRMKVMMRPLPVGAGILEQISGLRVPSVTLPAGDDDPELQRLIEARDDLHAQLQDLDRDQQRRSDQLAVMRDASHRLTARAEITRLAEEADGLRPKLSDVERGLADRRKTLAAIREAAYRSAADELADTTARGLQLLIDCASAAQTLGMAVGRWQPGQGEPLGLPSRPQLYKAYIQAIRQKYRQAGR